MTLQRISRLLVLALFLGGAGATHGQLLYRIDEHPILLDGATLAVADMSTFNAETFVGELGTSAQHLAYDPTTGDLLAYDSTNGLLRVHPETGVVTEVGPLGLEVEVRGLTVDIDGTPWALALDFSGADGTVQYLILRLDPGTGAVATVVRLGDQPLEDIAAVGTRLVAFSYTGHLVDVDPVTGQTTVGAMVMTQNVSGMSTGPNHDSLILLGFAEFPDRGVYRVDPDTGASVLLGNIFGSFGINHPALVDIAIAPARGIADVPSLGTLGIAILAMLLALAGLLIQRRG